MAIICDFTSTRGDTFPSAYLRIVSFSGRKTDLSFQAEAYDRDPRTGGRAIEGLGTTFVWDDASDVFTALYDYLKSMPQVSNPVDA
jgi:hypothetical protein